ncbi:MAG: NAD-dependent epimerase/dehydratase family protein [Patescibacteria group bacterium]
MYAFSIVCRLIAIKEMNDQIKEKKQTVFITGGLGFIGSVVCQRFLDAGYRVVVYDALKTYVSPLVDKNYTTYLAHRYRKLEGKVEVIQGEVQDYFKLRDAILSTEPNIIVHLAALPISDLSDKYSHEAVAAIYNGTHNILESIKDRPIQKFVLASSSMVYGDFQYRPCDEKHSTNPTGVYGVTKLGAEQLTQMYARRYKLQYAIIRPSAVYGPTDCNRRVTQIFLENAIYGKPIVLHGGGKSELDFTYVEDTAQGIFLAATEDASNGEIFNITYGQGRSLMDLATLVRQYFPNAEIVVKEVAEDERRPARGTMDISKARSLLGYNPRFSLEEGMKHYVAFLTNLHGEKI